MLKMADKESASPRAWQRMLSGRRLDLLEPSPLDIEIEDIAHGLARVARWNGQTSGPHAFSVAQHSLAVLAIFDHFWPEAAAAQRMTVLLHDAPEYVIGDMISPFKAIVGGDYKHVEARLQTAIHLRFSLPATTAVGLKDRIKRADMIAAFYEAIILAGFEEDEAVRFFGRPRGITPNVANFVPALSSEAQATFINTFNDIEAARQPV
jgi:uncharacterized protein